MRRAIEGSGLAGSVRIVENPSDDDRDRLYAEAHVVVIPSFHEGFCRPIIEGLRAGCLAIGYDGYNLPAAINGFGRVVRSGSVDALAEAMIDVAGSIAAVRNDPHQGVLRLDRGDLSVHDFERAVAEYVEEFAFASVAARMRKRLKSLIEGESVVSEDRARRYGSSDRRS